MYKEQENIEKDNLGNPKLRHISYDELHLMMTRLLLKREEEPEMFDGWENGKMTEGVTDFIQGESWRRDLFVKNER
jgi:hypothetical protein